MGWARAHEGLANIVLEVEPHPRPKGDRVDDLLGRAGMVTRPDGFDDGADSIADLPEIRS